MELREYLEILKRRKWFITAVTVLMATLAAAFSTLRPSVYQASATVLLRPNDAAEQLYPERAGARPADPNRNVAAQLDIVRSEAVVAAAAQTLQLAPAAVKRLQGEVSARQRQGTDVIEISVSGSNAKQAALAANAFTQAYIENRRQYAVTGLERASDEISGKLTELEARIADLNARVAQAKRGISVPGDPKKGIPASIVDSNIDPAPLEAARDAASVQYQTLYARQQELLVTKSLKRGEAEMIAEAVTPNGPISPNPKRDTMLGLIVGLLLGLGASLLREQLDERLRSREEVERVTSMPVLAELPLEAESAREPNAIATHERPLGALAESTRGLRTSLNFLGIDEPLRLIVVTSSNPGEGKSTVAANLAAAYAQAGSRTVIVSADMRRPRLEAIFNKAPGAGLSDLLAALPSTSAIATNGTNGSHRNGESSVMEVDPVQSAISSFLKPTHIDNLFILPAGHLPPNPAELLGSLRSTEVFRGLTGLADIVIIDSPPILAVTDAAVLASRADGVVLVASAGQTHRKALAQSVATLGSGRARLLGVVFNKVAQSGRSGYYGSYGGYLPTEPSSPRRGLRLWDKVSSR
jgi:succinoglycan biosynthesis transport protein ExoP